VQGYLDHQAGKLVRRFDAGSYVALADAMITHDVGRGRGGAANALQRIRAPLTVTSIHSDRLYPPRLQQQIVDLAPTAGPLHMMDALQGHDSFLLPDDGLAGVLRGLLPQDSPLTAVVPLAPPSGQRGPMLER
jgi:homoserine O-acetyltransferase